MGMSYLTSLNTQLIKNIAYVGSFGHILFNHIFNVNSNLAESSANCSVTLPVIEIQTSSKIVTWIRLMKKAICAFYKSQEEGDEEQQLGIFNHPPYDLPPVVPPPFKLAKAPLFSIYVDHIRFKSSCHFLEKTQ